MKFMFKYLSLLLVSTLVATAQPGPMVNTTLGTNAITNNNSGPVTISGALNANGGISVSGGIFNVDPITGYVTANRYIGNGSGITGITSVSGNVISTNVLGLTTKQGAQCISSFITQMQQLGYWPSVTDGAFFGTGLNTGTTNYLSVIASPVTGSAIYGGVAYNCIQTNTGYYLDGSTSVISNANTASNGPITIIIWVTGKGWAQTSFAEVGGVYGTAGWNFGGNLKMEYNSSAGKLDGLSRDTAGNNFLTPESGSGNHPITTDSYNRCLSISTDRTNFFIYQNGQISNPAQWFSGSIGLSPTNASPFTTTFIGARFGGGGVLDLNFKGVVHGYLIISNFLTLTQVQQIYDLALNTGCIQWRGLTMEGDSLTSGGGTGGGYCIYVNTNASFWGNCIYRTTAVGGSTVETAFSRLQSQISTNMPGANQVMYPPTVVYWVGANSMNNSPAYNYSFGSNECNYVHATGGKFYYVTAMQSSAYSALAGANLSVFNALVLANTCGADGVIDLHGMFTALNGSTNYVTNSFWFDLSSPPHNNPGGDNVIATNISAVIGLSAVLTSNNFLYNFHPNVPCGNPGLIGVHSTLTIVATNFTSNVKYTNTSGYPWYVSENVANISVASLGVTGHWLVITNVAATTNYATEGTTALSIAMPSTNSILSGYVPNNAVMVFTNVSTVGTSTLTNGQFVQY